MPDLADKDASPREEHYKYKPSGRSPWPSVFHHEFPLSNNGLSAQTPISAMYLLAVFLFPLAAIAAVIPRTLSGDELTQTTDTLIFSTTLSKFLYIKAFRPQSSSLDWTDDGCSNSPDEPLGFNFLPSCQRHDFAYRNFKTQNRFTEKERERIDKNFLTDLENMCGEERAPRKKKSCKKVAEFYYGTVRRLGGLDFGEGVVEVEWKGLLNGLAKRELDGEED
jgi:hypothetical protein